jgi:peptide/nickel transport system permease protein
MGAGAAGILSGAEAGLDLVESGQEIAARSPSALFWRRFRRDRVAGAAAIFILLLVVVAIFAPLVVKLAGLPSPYKQNPNLTGPFGEAVGPSAAHPFGVDQLGEDVASRVIYGARVSLEVGVVGTAIAALIGVVLGMIAGYYRGWIDSVISFFVNVTLSIPILLLGLGIGAACAVRGCAGGTIRPGVGVIIFLIAFATWSYFARVVRGLVLSLREREFVQAARALGASDLRIMFREILPNLVAPIIVYATLQIPLNILIEAALSYLGVGVKPPTASWGQMISAATPTFTTAWWYMVFPGAALLLTVLAFNLFGDGLRDALNPRTTR